MMKKIVNLVIAAALVVSSTLITVPAMAAEDQYWDFENTEFTENNSDDGLYRWPIDNQAEIVDGGGIDGSKGFKLATTKWSQLYKQGLNLTEGVYAFGASVRLTQITPHVLFRFGSGAQADSDGTAFTIAEINNGAINLNGNQACIENKIAKTVTAEIWYTLDAIVDLDSDYCVVTVKDSNGNVYAKNRYAVTNESIGWFGFNIPYANSMPDSGNVYVDNMYIKSYGDDSIVLVDDNFSSYTSGSEGNYLPYFGGGYPQNSTYKRATENMAESGALKLTNGYAIRYMPTMLLSDYGWLTPSTPFVSSGKLKIEFKMNVSSADNGQLTVDIKNQKRTSSITALFADSNALIDSNSGQRFENYSMDEDIFVEIIYDTADGSYTTTLKNTNGISETLSGTTTLPSTDTSVAAVWVNCTGGTVTLDDLKIAHITGEEPAGPDVIFGEKAAISGQLDGAEINENGEFISDGETISAWTITADASKFHTGDTIKATLKTGETSSSKLGVIPTVEGGQITFYVLINRAADSVQSVEFTPAQ